jgi:hypothetical protein
VTIHFDEHNEQLLRDTLVEGEEFFNRIVPRPKEFDEGEKWYMWNVDNWGTKWDSEPHNVIWGEGSVTFSLSTAWSPPIAFYRALVDMGYDVVAYYLEEGMCFCGEFDNGADDYIEYSDMSLEDMESLLPDWVNDEWGIIDRKRDDEQWERDEAHNDWLSELERTEWIDGKVKPIHEGMYEVKTKDLNFPYYRQFKDGAWDTLCLGGDENPTVWRGITEEQHMDIVLDELNEHLKDLE